MASSRPPYFFEDTKGLPFGPTDFLDIYDRPPFLRLVSSHHDALQHRTRSTDESQSLYIYELGARTFMNPRRQIGSIPSAAISFQGDLNGSITIRSSPAMQIGKWLRKSMTFGSTLIRQFKASDGMYYQWSFRKVPEHEWACIQLGTNYLVAHYDLKSSTEPRSCNVLTVYENWVHLSVELLASLTIMRRIHLSHR